MIKMVTLLKRRPGMSMDEFIDYYESTHRLIGESVIKPHAVYYARRYLDPIPNVLTGESEEPDHDVLMEIWFPDQAAFDAAMAAITDPEHRKIIEADEVKLFDRPKMRSFIVREFESDLNT